MIERPECGRCHASDRDADVRLWVADLEREHRLDGVPHVKPDWDHQYRCRACRERNRQAPSKRSPEA